MYDPLLNPSEAELLFALYAQRQSGLPIANIGMGDLPNLPDEELRRRLQLIEAARRSTYKTWRGLDVRHTAAHGSKNYEFTQFDIFVALDKATRVLNQATFDFLTLRDAPSAKLDCRLVGTAAYLDSDNVIQTAFIIPEETAALTAAVKRQMLSEAQPYRQHLTTGVFVLMREPLTALDERIVYDTLRLVITPLGIAGSIVSETWYIPFWWSPEGICTAQVWLPGEVRVLVDVLLSGIWRDACVVEEVFVERRDKGRGYQASGTPQHKNTLVRLPQRVYKSQWGSTAERDNINAVLRRAHHVRAHYARLPDGRKRSEQADALALEYQFAPIPDGYTFVRPHERGTGEVMPAVRPVVCRGLQRVRLLLNK